MERRTYLETGNSFQWTVSNQPVSYEEALKGMDIQVKALQNREGPESAWLLEHPPLYTLGSSGHDKDILASATLPIFKTGRGGQVTYHGPGQRVIYVVLDLKTRYQDVRRYVFELEEWMIKTLAHLGVRGERRPGRVGIWVQKKGHDYKIAALGVRVQKWVTSHGMALNVKPDLAAYQDIIPCGISEYGVTSLADLGLSVTLQEVDEILHQTFPFSLCA